MALDFVGIRSIAAVPLMGESPKGGWSAEIKPDDSVHTLIVVHTDAGITGLGSVFTNGGLVEAALKVLEPLYTGENALEPERVSEKLHQNTFWMGRGGTLTHTISGIDIALWDILGKALQQPVGRLLGGTYRKRVKPYCSLLMEEPEPLAETLAGYREQGFRAFKIGWGPFRPARRFKARRSDRPRRARCDRRGQPAFRRCRCKRCLLAQRLALGDQYRAHACRLRSRLVRGSLAARRDRRFLRIAPRKARCRWLAAKS